MPPPAAPEPAAAPCRPAPASPAPELLAAVAAATSLVDAYRTHGTLARGSTRSGPSRSETRSSTGTEGQTSTPELQRLIPAPLLGLHVPAETLAEALPLLEETYCGTMAFEIEHLRHEERRWLTGRSSRVSSRAGDSRRSATCSTLPSTVEAFESTSAVHSSARAILDRRARRARPDARRVDRARRAPGRTRGRRGHGAPWATQRPRPRPGPAVRGNPPRVRGRTAPDRRRNPEGQRRREVPPRRGRHPADRGGPIPSRSSPNPSHLEAVDPVVEGWTRAKQDLFGATGRPARRSRAGPGPRRRGVRRAGRRGRDVQPRRPARATRPAGRCT